MKTVKVCVGSACHIKGAPEVIETYKRLIAENSLACNVVLKGCFCLQNCADGVSVDIDGHIFSGLSPFEAEIKFRQLIMGE
jgi:NADH:ubiquinone oxidoreductase subunit E